MVGGNAYVLKPNSTDIDFELVAFPKNQLFVRWAQVTAFLPSVQYSIPPWHYDNDTSVPVSKICKDLEIIRDQEVTPILIKEAKQSVLEGTPIIRPVWWIDNSDPSSYKIADEFLVGNQILVAPITDEDTYKRDIYVPRGKWLDPSNGKIHDGPLVLKDYPAPIEKIPYFIAK